MSLNKRELSWQKRKEEKIPKHMIKRESLVVQDEKWREETAKEFADKYGAWWIFSGMDLRHQKKNKNWIMQYWKGDRRDASEE